MYYTYILRSKTYPDKIYVGCTQDLKTRLAIHNNGESTHTAKYKPWKLEFYSAFADKELAFNFEKYLKTPNGKQLLQKHFIAVGSTCAT